MTSKKINEAIAALKARDPQEYRSARAAYHKADIAYKAAAKEIGLQGVKHYATLKRYVMKALEPHRVEWRQTGDMYGQDVNHDKWTTSLHLWGEVWPKAGGKNGYRMHMRAHIPFSMGPRDGKEFLEMVALLKAAADAMTDNGL